MFLATLLLAQLTFLYPPDLPVLAPAQQLPVTIMAWNRAPACTLPTDCPPYPSHWYIYRNGKIDQRIRTTFYTPVEGDRAHIFWRSTATRSIEVAAVNELIDPANPRISARVPLALQTPVTVRNPTQVKFLCPDHAQDTGHEIDIVNATTGVVIQTISAGDPAADAQGVVTFTINVQPIAFGSYTVRARATAGDIQSPNSPDSDPWERSPGAPSKPSVQ